MNEIREDRTMILLHGAGITLATRDMAMIMAEMITKNYGGEDNYKKQLPMKITEMPDSWIVKGSREYDYNNVNESGLIDGPIEIEIAKYNCQVIKLAWDATLPPPPGWRIRER